MKRAAEIGHASKQNWYRQIIRSMRLTVALQYPIANTWWNKYGWSIPIIVYKPSQVDQRMAAQDVKNFVQWPGSERKLTISSLLILDEV